ncbi:hypothetical protein O181_007082 [Austropuccinia psidii MF-1]|uniref:Reverse transcriptase domain-containing protein n=1 Tax=Austropuccinia psidii MF-1 TaxID=1389203 RepID=A0A9Q3GI53_9BASI|nr:hypothetical protein [Austropuccinia psidii MF-1]
MITSAILIPLLIGKNGIITYDSSRKDSSGINSSTINELDTAVNSVSLAKEEKPPPHHACDHHIDLEGLLPPVGVIYSLSNQESETLQAYISENLENGFIRQGSSPTGAPVLFVKKKDGGLCLCVDYRKLNAVTRKNRYPVAPMNQLLTVSNSSTIFSKIDLHGAYNLQRIKEGDEHLTAFITKYGSYAIWPYQCSGFFPKSC